MTRLWIVAGQVNVEVPWEGREGPWISTREVPSFIVDIEATSAHALGTERERAIARARSIIMTATTGNIQDLFLRADPFELVKSVPGVANSGLGSRHVARLMQRMSEAGYPVTLTPGHGKAAMFAFTEDPGKLDEAQQLLERGELWKIEVSNILYIGNREWLSEGTWAVQYIHKGQSKHMTFQDDEDALPSMDQVAHRILAFIRDAIAEIDAAQAGENTDA